MAKPRVPLLSFDAQGRLGKDVVFTGRGKRRQVRKRAIPTDPRSPGQLARRSWFQECIAAWHQLTDAEKLFYENLDPTTWPNPGYLNFMKLWLVGEVPNHPADHETGGKGEISLLNLAGSPVGPCQHPGGGIHAFQQLQKVAVARWVLPGWYSANYTTYGYTAGYFVYIPIYPPQQTTYDRIGVYVEAGAAGLARLGIYNWANGLPSSLVLDAGTVDVTAPGAKAIAISQTLERQYYYLAIVVDVTPTLRTLSTGDALAPPVPGINTSYPPFWYLLPYLTGRQADVAGGLPDPAHVPTDIRSPSFCPLAMREA